MNTFFHFFIVLICFSLSACFKKSNSKSSDNNSLTIKIPSIEWAVQESETSGEYCLSLKIDSSGNIFCSGTITNSSTIGTFDAYIKKLNPDGSLAWLKIFGSNGLDVCQGLDIDSSGYLYCSGRTNGVFGEANFGGDDAFIIKLTPSGDTEWVKQIGTLGSDECKGVVVDNSGNVYCAGGTHGALNEAYQGQEDAFVIKLNSDGNTQWIKQIGSSSPEKCYGIALNSFGDVFCGGTTFGNLTNVYVGGSDAFVVKLDKLNGDILWIKQFGSGGTECRGIEIDSTNNIFCAGGTTADLDETNAGERDAYIAKLDQFGNISWITQLGVQTSVPGFKATKTHEDFCLSVSSDLEGNIYCAGRTEGSLGKQNPGGDDAFILMLKPNGEISWLKQIGTNEDDSFFSFELNNTKDIFLCGEAIEDLGEDYTGTYGSFVMKLSN